MRSFAGRTIALLEHRYRDELATLVARHGGVPISAPAMGEVACHDDVIDFIDGLTARRFSLAVFLSGAGPSTLLEEAERRGRLNDVLGALRQVAIACRGAKPLAVLHRYGLRPRLTTGRPHTTHELLEALSHVDVQGRGVVLVHTGERNDAVSAHLRGRGARLREICPYMWTLPEDLGLMTQLVRDAIAHRVDAMLFTSQVQCRHLFQVASEMQRAQGLALSLNQHIVVGAVGPVCARALRASGVAPDVVPQATNMPALIDAVAHYFEATS